ncbi:MAG: DNA-directed RNA polymerase subunit beta' [Pseudomonadota bacterium]
MQNRALPTSEGNWIERLRHAPRLEGFGPVSARFIHSMRLIALHEQAGRDPVPELAGRLGSISVAAKSLELSQAVCATWPENIHVSPFCCQAMTHDEMTIALMIEAVIDRDRTAFVASLEGLIRPDRVERLWDCALGLVTMEIAK